ncbi:MAG: FGGY family carbohydrate kinase, partial [Candidatus Atribacteria bacterium]|nr:FGGY family carbohydrate kinase [Candidatus Atribacteria bacterium]
MRGDLTLAVDIGTSSCKIGVYDRKGELLFAAKRDYPSFSPQPSFAEQDPKDILRNISEAVKEAVEQYTPHSFAILAFDTMLHSTIFIDREGNPLYPLLNWMDTRSAGEVEELQGEYQAHGFYFRNGVPLHTIYHLPRVFWFRKNKPHILHETWKVVAIKDWILWKLTGVLLCDYSTASGTGFLNLSQCEWDAEILEMAEFPVEKLPELCEPEHVAPLQDSEFQRETGLPVALPVIWGGGDGPYANLGEGMFHQGE